MAIDIIMRCVNGEEWPLESFKSFVQIRDSQITEESVIFSCPAGHDFTLKQALAKNIFTREEADKLINQANKLKVQYAGNQPRQASDYIPNKEVSALDILCVCCGKKAQWSAGGKPSEDMAKCKEFALCLECRADWSDYDTKEAFNLLTWGKASDLFWEAIFDRFIKHLPVLDRFEAEKLLTECRKKARKTSSRRPR